MGAHYGSIQLRTTDHTAAVAVAERVARDRKILCLVGPAINGWVGIYPTMNGQDENVGAEVAKAFGGLAIHILIHDDDVMAYWLWREGQLVDSYWSRPGYFGEEQRAKEEAMAGNPAQFASILGDKTNRLDEILDRNREIGAIESERLEQFADLLGIANALTAYEYLKEGETEGIKGRRKFRDVPSDVADAEAERKKQESRAFNQLTRDRRRAAKAQQEQLRNAGILLFREERKVDRPAVGAIDGGFAIAWSGPNATFGLDFCAPPWRAVESLGIEFVGHFVIMSTEPSGLHLAACAGDHAVVYEFAANHLSVVKDFKADDRVMSAALSQGGKQIAYATPDTIIISEVATERRIAVIDTEDTLGLLFPPNGDSLIALPHSGVPLLIPASKSPIPREIFIGGKSPALPLFGTNPSALREIDEDALIADHQRSLEASFAQLSRMFEKAGKKTKAAANTTSEFAQIRKEFERQSRRGIARIRALKARRGPVFNPNEMVSTCVFSRNGKFLCFATNRSLTVFEWQAVLQSSKSMPAPVWRLLFDSQPHIYAMESEVDREAILFVRKNQIFRLDLANGEVQELYKPSENTVICSITLSNDGNTLGIVYDASSRSGNRRVLESVWEVWSYPQFREQARFVIPS